MLAALVAKLDELSCAGQSATGKLAVVDLPDNQFLLVDHNGSAVCLGDEDCPQPQRKWEWRTHELSTVADFKRTVDRVFQSDLPLVYVGDAVHCFEDNEDTRRHEIIRCKLEATQEWIALLGLSDSNFTASDLVTLARTTIRTMFADGATAKSFIETFRSINTLNTAATNTDVGPGKANYGKHVTSTVTSTNGGLEQWDEFSLTVPRYTDSAVDTSVTVLFTLIDDPARESFKLIPILGQIEAAEMEAKRIVQRELINQFDAEYVVLGCRS